jgi:hypothetical protein
MKDTWKITKSLTNVNPNIQPLTINGKTATTIQEKLNTFADTVEQLSIQIQMLIVSLQLTPNR